jgi:hypothetical protein
LFISAIVGRGTVKDDSCDISGVVCGLKYGLGTVKTGVIGGIAADVGDVIVGDVVDIGEVCVIQIARDLIMVVSTRRSTWPGKVGRTVALAASRVNGTSSAIWLPSACFNGKVPWN